MKITFTALGVAVIFLLTGPDAQAGTTNITSCGNLTTANETYVLQNNVSSAKTCFVIKNDGITLDLNGKTVTYGTTTVTVPNSGFETGTGTSPTSWDLSNAPQATRHAGSLVSPVSLFTGSYSLQFDLPGSAQYVTTSADVFLAANTTYALTAMVYNYASDDITVTVELDGTSYTASHAGITWRGFQLVNVVFRPTTAVNAPIKISLSGSGLSTNGNIYVDDVQVQPARYYGVAIPTYDNGRLPDIDVDALPSGNPDNVTIKNGTIIQGAGNPFSGHNFYFVEGAFDVEIDSVTATVQGPESSNIFAEWSYNNTFHHNTLTSNVQAIVSRDNFSAAQINIGRTRGNNLIYNNTIQNGPHSGIMMGDYNDSSTGGSKIYNNTFRMKARHTNGFAIAGGDRNGLVYNNSILNVDGYYGRGIHGGNGTKFYDNHIEVSDVAYNQEYDGCQPPGVYGFQVEEGSGTEVTSNTIIARTGAGLCNAMGLRFTSPFDGIVVDGNTVTAVDADGTDSYRAYVASFSRGDGDDGDMSGAPLTNNTFTSNSSWMDYGYYAPSSPNHINFEGNTFILGASLQSFIAQHGVSATEVVFVDNVYGSTAAKAALEEANIYRTANPDANSDFTVKWHYDPIVKDANNNPVSGATVVVKNGSGTTVFTGTTNASGRLPSPPLLTAFINDGGSVTEYGPYTASITLPDTSSTVTDSITNDDVNTSVDTTPSADDGADSTVTDGTSNDSNSTSNTINQPSQTVVVDYVIPTPLDATHSFFAYASTLRHGFTVAAGDVLGSGAAEIVTGTATGLGPHVRVFDRLGTVRSQFYAYDSSLRYGVQVAVCNIDGTGASEIVTAQGKGGWPLVRIFDGYGRVIHSGFFVLDGKFTGGVNLACGDTDGDGISEIIVAAQQGGGPHVLVYNRYGRILTNFMAYDQRFRGGINVSTADADGDSKDEIITGPMNGAPHVQIFQIRPNELKRLSPGFYAFSPDYRGGVQVAGVDTDGDGTKEILIGTGTNAQPQVKVYDIGERLQRTFYAYATNFHGGVMLTGGDVDGDGQDELVAIPRSNGGPHVRVMELE